MSETTLAIVSFAKLIWCCFFALFYSLGGTVGFGKWIRRFVGPLWMGCGLLMFAKLQGTFNYWQLLYPVLLCASLHLGYGGTDDVGIKIRKRLLYGFAIAICSLPLAIISGFWILFGIHCAMCCSMSVLLGVFNPTDSARSEETLIACLSSVLPLFLI